MHPARRIIRELLPLADDEFSDVAFLSAALSPFFNQPVPLVLIGDELAGGSDFTALLRGWRHVSGPAPNNRRGFRIGEGGMILEMSPEQWRTWKDGESIAQPYYLESPVRPDWQNFPEIAAAVREFDSWHSKRAEVRAYLHETLSNAIQGILEQNPDRVLPACSNGHVQAFSACAALVGRIRDNESAMRHLERVLALVRIGTWLDGRTEADAHVDLDLGLRLLVSRLRDGDHALLDWLVEAGSDPSVTWSVVDIAEHLGIGSSLVYLRVKKWVRWGLLHKSRKVKGGYRLNKGVSELVREALLQPHHFRRSSRGFDWDEYRRQDRLRKTPEKDPEEAELDEILPEGFEI